MTISYRFGVRAAVALALLACCACFPTAAATSTVAGWVDVSADVAPYVVLRVVDDSTGVVVRSAPLDATHTFSFAGIVPPAVSVEVVAQLPDHLYELDAAASVLRTAAANTQAGSAADAPVQLKVAATAKTAGAASANSNSSSSSIVSAVSALAALVAAWYGRHRLVSLLELPTFKPPKQRKMMMAM